MTGEKTSPKYYTDQGQYAPNLIIEHYDLNFHLGNTLKYVLRAGKKPGESKLDDLRKAQWYLNRQVELEEQLDAQ